MPERLSGEAPAPPVRAVRVIFLDGRPDCVVYGVERGDEFRGFVRLKHEGRIIAAFDAAEIRRTEEIR